MTDTDPKIARRIYRKFSPDYLAGLAESAAGTLLSDKNFQNVRSALELSL